MTDPGASDADRLLDIDLPHSYRGLDPEAVQELLTEAVGSLRQSQEREVELRTVVAALEAELAEARADATAELEEAKRRGRQMVTEAQTIRRRILEDLIRRRKVLRRQIEQLRVGRERLLEAYEVVGLTVEEATAELGVALPAAQAAAERAGRRLGPDVEEVTGEELHAIEAEIDAARAAGLPILDPPTTAERAAATAAAAATADVADDETVPPLGEVEPTLAAVEEMRLLGPAAVAPDPVTDAVVDEPEPEPELEPEVDQPEPEPEVDQPEPEPEVDQPVPDEALTLPLFDRLRAGEPEPAIDVVEAIEAEPGGEEAPDPVAVLADDLARRLRRALADEQNQVLDRLRQDRKGQLGLDGLLGDAGATVARLATAIEPRLREAALEGAAVDDAGAADLAARLAGLVADGVRADIDRLAEGGGAGVQAGEAGVDLVHPVREAFRAWRTDRILPMATEVAAEVLGS